MVAAKIKVLDRDVSIYAYNEVDYICITDIAKYKSTDKTDDLIRNWIRNRNTIEFLGIWEQLNNPGFNPVEFDGIKMQAGLNSFTLTPKQCLCRRRCYQGKPDSTGADKTTNHAGVCLRG